MFGFLSFRLITYLVIFIFIISITYKGADKYFPEIKMPYSKQILDIPKNVANMFKKSTNKIEKSIEKGAKEIEDKL